MDSITVRNDASSAPLQVVSRRAGLSFGAATVFILGSGLVLNAYLAVVARSVSAAEYSYFGSFWSLALLVGFGAFLPIEQEVARRLRAPGDRRSMLRNATVVAGVIVFVSFVLLAAATPLLWPAIGQQPGTLVALAILSIVSAVQFVVRGLLIGQGRLGQHGLVQLVDAALRLAFAATVAALTSADSSTFAWTLVFAIAVVHLPLLPVLVRRAQLGNMAGAGAEPRSSSRSFAVAVAPLLLAALCGQLLLNGIPVLVSALAESDEQAQAGRFLAAFLLTRIPLFVVVPLQTAFIPIFVAVAAARSRLGLARVLSRFAGVVAALAAVGVAVSLTIGPALVELVFGAQYRLPGTDLALMAAGVSAHVGLLVVTQALVAAERHRAVGLSWLAGLGAAAVVFAAVPDLLLRAELAFLLGSVVGWLAGTVQLRTTGSHEVAENAP